MKLLFKVNQKKALIQGINASHSTAVVEINPEELSQEEREVLAEHLDADGHDCTRIRIVKPTLEGVRERLTELVEFAAKERAEEARRNQEYEQEVLAAIEAGPEYETRYAYLSAETVEYKNYQQALTVPVQLPFTKAPITWGRTLSEATQQAWQDFEKQVEQSRRETLAKLRPQLEELHRKEQERAQAQKREAAAKKEADQAEYAKLVARLPETLRERYEAGYASYAEVVEAIVSLCLADKGFTAKPFEYSEDEKLETLTGAEFVKLKAVRAELSEGQTAEPYEISYYRPATEDDDVDEIDSDGEVKEYDRCIVVAWKQAGLSIAARVGFE